MKHNTLKEQIASLIAAALISGALYVAIFGTPVHF
jgi:hypothetical protein